MKIDTSEVVDNEIILNVDYTKTVEQTIADGKYGWVNKDITVKNFPTSPEMIGKKVEVFAKLFHFNNRISSDYAISEMDKAGYRPATLMELLTLGILFPELQRRFPIVALGSVWCFGVNFRCVTYLDVLIPLRGLYLNSIDSYWSARCRFLGVRK